jgi:2-oxoglutarate ferredoxin oxidoreductase subunit beta
LEVIVLGSFPIKKKFGCSFVARGFAGEIEHLTGLIKDAILHNGFAFIDILQPCVSFNRVNTLKWYADRVYPVDDGPEYNSSDRLTAFTKAQQWGDRIPIGIIYRQKRPPLDGQLSAIAGASLVAQKIDSASFSGIFETFR